jgi:hypothetical protein
MKLIKPIIHNPSFKSVRPILKTWFSVLSNYAVRAKDSPFWYRERTQIGFLAIAAWLSGWAVLEEWRTEKNSDGKKSNGRNDLWIGKGKLDWYIEAKHTWCEIHKSEEKILKILNRAFSDAKSSMEKLKCESSKKVAAVFVSPAWKGKSKSDFDRSVKKWIDVCKKAEADAIVIVLSEFDECAKGRQDELFIGSVLFLVGVRENIK